MGRCRREEGEVGYLQLLRIAEILLCEFGLCVDEWSGRQVTLRAEIRPHEGPGESENVEVRLLVPAVVRFNVDADQPQKLFDYRSAFAMSLSPQRRFRQSLFRLQTLF